MAIKMFSIKFNRLLAALIVILLSSSECEPIESAEERRSYVTRYVRLRRQDEGYVYKKPNVSFDLPSRPRSRPPTTQAPTVDRTQAQQMYYAYPGPAVAGTVNIGYSSTSTTAGGYAGSSTSRGYGGSASTAAPGYSYGSVSTSGTQATIGYGTSSTAMSQSASTGKTAGTAGSTSGYSYGTPSSTTQATTAGSTAGSTQGPTGGVSTNAPKYLPPLEGSSTVGGNVVTIGSSSQGSTPASTSGSTSVSTEAVSSQGAISTTPSDVYLPPKKGSPSTSAPPPAPTAGYLPPSPNSNPPSSLGTSPSNLTPTPPPPTGGYLPPFSGSTTSGGVSTPAITYLPPVLR